MKKVSYLFAAALVIKLLTGCHHPYQDRYDAPSEQSAAPATSKVVVVRVDSQNPQSAEYVNLDSAPSKESFSQFATNYHDWQAVDNSKVIDQSQGYPVAHQGSYFVEHPKDFVAAKGQNLTALYGYGRGCGYCGYPNYYGYGNGSYNHYYPNAYVNYGLYSYLPTYYSNYSYWYYQPYAYYPAYYNYNYYIYTSWW